MKTKEKITVCSEKPVSDENNPSFIVSSMLFLLPACMFILLFVPRVAYAKEMLQVHKDIESIPGIKVIKGSMQIHLTRESLAFSKQQQLNMKALVDKLVTLATSQIAISQEVAKQMKGVTTGQISVFNLVQQPTFNYISPQSVQATMAYRALRTEQLLRLQQLRVEELKLMALPQISETLKKVLRLSGGFFGFNLAGYLGKVAVDAVKSKIGDIVQKNEEKGKEKEEKISQLRVSQSNNFLTFLTGLAKNPYSFAVALIAFLILRKDKTLEAIIPTAFRPPKKSYFVRVKDFLIANPTLIIYVFAILMIGILLVRNLNTKEARLHATENLFSFLQQVDHKTRELSMRFIGLIGSLYERIHRETRFDLSAAQKKGETVEKENKVLTNLNTKLSVEVTKSEQININCNNKLNETYALANESFVKLETCNQEKAIYSSVASRTGDLIKEIEGVFCPTLHQTPVYKELRDTFATNEYLALSKPGSSVEDPESLRIRIQHYQKFDSTVYTPNLKIFEPISLPSDRPVENSVVVTDTDNNTDIGLGLCENDWIELEDNWI